jgi:hypothetical protein
MFGWTAYEGDAASTRLNQMPYGLLARRTHIRDH